MNNTESRVEKALSRLNEWMESEQYMDKLNQRVSVLSACENSMEARAYAYDLAKNDPIFFIETFGWVFDPRPEYKPNFLPFIMFDFQKDALLWIVNHIKEGEDGLTEKSRDMGVTWLYIWAFVWFWNFSDSFSGLLGSYKEALVDDRTLDSHFGKIDYIINNLPQWILPPRFNKKEHRRGMKIINPYSGNLITGDTMNPDFARGSRKTAVFLDEGASWEYFRDAWESAGDTTPCRLTCSTPKGRNSFAILRDSGIDVLTLHWKLHPLKDQEWYEYEKSRRTDEEVAQELDISYNKSVEGRVYPEWDNVEWGHFPYNPEKPLYVSWDFGKTDHTAIIWYQPLENHRVAIVDAYESNGKLIDWYVPFITGEAPSDTKNYTKRDLRVIESHRNWKPAIHYGDPAGRFTNQVVNKSVIDVLQDYNIKVYFKEEAKDFQTRKTKTKLLLKNLCVNDNENTRELSVAMENASYPKVRSGGTEEVRSIKPIHNWTSHFRSSLEYFAVNYDGRSGSRQVRDRVSNRSHSLKRITSY